MATVDESDIFFWLARQFNLRETRAAINDADAMSVEIVSLVDLFIFPKNKESFCIVR